MKEIKFRIELPWYQALVVQTDTHIKVELYILTPEGQFERDTELETEDGTVFEISESDEVNLEALREAIAFAIELTEASVFDADERFPKTLKSFGSLKS